MLDSVQWKKRSKEGVQEKKNNLKEECYKKQQKANEERALLETEEQLTEKVVDIIGDEIK